MAKANQVVRKRVGAVFIAMSPLIIHLVTASALAGDIYQYIERDGTISFTNVPSDHRYQKVVPDTVRSTPRSTRSSQSAAPDSTSSDPLSSVLSSVHSTHQRYSPLPWRAYQAERHVEEAITRHAGLQQLNPALVRAVIKAESDFDPRALSRTGAVGLMQLMPQTALEVGVTNPYDVESNISGGTKYLRALLNRFDGNLSLALAAYNAGPNSVERNRGIPPIQETREYVNKVLRFYRAFLSAAPSIRSSEASRPTPAASGAPLFVFS